MPEQKSRPRKLERHTLVESAFYFVCEKRGSYCKPVASFPPGRWVGRLKVAAYLLFGGSELDVIRITAGIGAFITSTLWAVVALAFEAG